MRRQAVRDGDGRAWRDVVRMPFEDRLGKPRSRGLTMVIDKGMGVSAAGEFLDMASQYVDIVKLSFGTSALYPEDILMRKTEMLKDRGVFVCPGGTFAEVALIQGKFNAYLDYAERVGFDWIEVSDGSIELSMEDRQAAVNEAKNRGFRVMTEVGKKHPDDSLSVPDLARQMLRDLETGANYVVLEARESGRGVTIFGPDGSVQQDGLRVILSIIDEPHRDRIIWEAPRAAQQREFVLGFGPNVNLGNVSPDEVLAVEALRLGLRGDTLREYFRLNGNTINRE